MMRKHLLISQTVLAAVLFSGAFAWAAEPPAPELYQAQAGAEAAKAAQGPSALELQKFEQELGAPVGSYAEPQIARPDFEEPGTLPADLRNLVPEQDVVQIYCLMARYKSGRFFATLDALDKNLIPAAEKVRAMGVTLEVPGIQALRTAGEERLAAICAAGGIDQAETLVREFSSWGQNIGQEGFTKMMTDLEAEMKAKGDALRAKIQAEIDPFVQLEKVRLEAEIRAEVQGQVDAKQAQFQGATEAPDVGAIENQVRQTVNASVAKKKAALEATIKSKVDAIMGMRSAGSRKLKACFPA
ncbi:MAG: hypothetical protein V1821_00380 [bacterium]